MDIEEYKLLHGYKELPIWFYFRGMFAWIFPVGAVIGLICRFGGIPFWVGAIAIAPWTVLWGIKGFKAYKRDKSNR